MWRVLVVLAGLAMLGGRTSGAMAQAGDGSSRDEPLPIGEIFEVGDYEVTVLSVNPDAEVLVLAEYQYNDPAPVGDVMVLVRVEATYTGTETGDPGWDLMFKTVGSENRGYTQTDKDCGSIPEGEFTAGELFPDGSAQYNLCWMVSEAEAPTLIMYVEPLFAFDSGGTIWISLDPEQVLATPAA